MQINGQTDIQTYIQTDRQTDRQTDTFLAGNTYLEQHNRRNQFFENILFIFDEIVGFSSQISIHCHVIELRSSFEYGLPVHI